MANARLKDVEILIVDDQKMIQRLVHAILTTFGFRSITVGNSGRQGIEILKRRSFDLIITDWRMGDLDGIDILRFVRNSPQSLSPNTPIIFLTGNTEYRDIAEARDAGVNEYLSKPFSAEELIGRIRSVIERPRSFIISPTYRGPDRRHATSVPPGGINRRRKREQK